MFNKHLHKLLKTKDELSDLALKKLSIDLLSMDRCDRVLRPADIAGTVVEWIPALGKTARKRFCFYQQRVLFFLLTSLCLITWSGFD